MNAILVVSLICILTVQLSLSQKTPQWPWPKHGPGPVIPHPPWKIGPPGRFDKCISPKIPGCCEFFEAFGEEMDGLKNDPELSCKTFTDEEQREECKMQKILIARSKFQPPDQCKERMQEFVQGTPPSTTTVA